MKTVCIIDFFVDLFHLHLKWVILVALVNFLAHLFPLFLLQFVVLNTVMSVGDQFDLHVLAILSAVAATVAKQIIFYVSYGGRKIIKEETRKRMRPFERLVKRYGAGAAFLQLRNSDSR